jgi:hypothetical protein
MCELSACGYLYPYPLLLCRTKREETCPSPTPLSPHCHPDLAIRTPRCGASCVATFPAISLHRGSGSGKPPSISTTYPLCSQLLSNTDTEVIEWPLLNVRVRRLSIRDWDPLMRARSIAQLLTGILQDLSICCRQVNGCEAARTIVCG